MNAIEQLKSVLCDPTGKCCIKGSEEDRAIVDRALEALAQRTWVGLTDEETIAIELGLRIPTGYRDAYDLSLRDFAKAIEAKLKEKNT
jgi:hypothetical protein